MVLFDPEGGTHFKDVRDVAKARAEALAAKMRERGYWKVGAYWHNAAPVYGSKAYQQREAQAWATNPSPSEF